MGVVRRTWVAGLLGLGLICLISALFALLDAARIEQAQSGIEFTRAATSLRWIVAGEVGAVALTTCVVVWRLRPVVRRVLALAVVVWGITLLDFAFLAMAGAVPR